MDNVIISSHVLLFGAAHALRDYLLKNKTRKLLFISLPLVDQSKTSSELFLKGKPGKIVSFDRKIKLGSLDYIIDIVWIIYQSLKFGNTDLFIGVDPLNAICGIILQKLGRVKKVIYYGIDFVPIRFENKLVNKIFHGLESYCVKNSDEVWNVSPRMAEGRYEFLNINPKIYQQKTVPIGVAPNTFNLDKKSNQAIFVGHILEKQGLQIVLDSVKLIANKIPDFKLIIVGGGEYLDVLIRKSKRLKIDKYVVFLGWISDRKKLEELLASSSLAIACYKPEKMRLRNFTYYADPTKIKDYLNFGLPVILTDVSYNASEIDKKECGIIVGYKKDEISSAVIKILKDKNRLKRYSINARKYAAQFNWDTIFKKALYKISK